MDIDKALDRWSKLGLLEGIEDIELKKEVAKKYEECVDFILNDKTFAEMDINCNMEVIVFPIIYRLMVVEHYKNFDIKDLIVYINGNYKIFEKELLEKHETVDDIEAETACLLTDRFASQKC